LPLGVPGPVLLPLGGVDLRAVRLDDPGAGAVLVVAADRRTDDQPGEQDEERTADEQQPTGQQREPEPQRGAQRPTAARVVKRHGLRPQPISGANHRLYQRWLAELLA